MTPVYNITIAGIGVTEFIKEQPRLPRQKGAIGQLIEIPSVTLLADNTKGVFTPGGDNSIFPSSFRGDPIIITKDGDTIYEGEIRNVMPQNAGMVANIECTAKINRILQASLPGFISDQKTFAELSREIYALYGVETDDYSYERSRVCQEDLLLQARANVRLDSQLSVLSAQQWLANVGLCRHYFIGNIAYMDFVDTNQVSTPMGTFTDSDILEIRSYGLIDEDPYDGYEVITAGGTASKAGLNIPGTLDAGVDKDFVIASPETGYNWGDAMIALTNHERYRIEVWLTKGVSQSLDLGTHFAVNSVVTGIVREFEVVGVEESSLIGPIIIGESI